MGTRIFQVDSFTDRPFAGNPAGVCLLEESNPRAEDEHWLQAVAREMNLAETAFVRRRTKAQAEGFNLRWFTPMTEVDLCGHATLAAAHVLWQEGWLEPGAEGRFQTRSGLLRASRREEGWIELDFPAEPAEPADATPQLLQALGLRSAQVRYCGKNRFDYLIEVDGEAAVRALQPDFARLKSLGQRGVMVTASSDSDRFDFISRFFAPGVGIDEDPVTGSAHCCLGPYWAARFGKGELVAFQASARGGVLKVRPAGDRVFLYGQAVTVLRGELV